MAKLGFNIESVAAMRQTGKKANPDPVTGASLAEIGGVKGIVCPVNDDFSPITERDVKILKETTQSHFNLQMPLTESMIALALSVKPDMVTLIPDTEQAMKQPSMEMLAQNEHLNTALTELHEHNIVVSVLISPHMHYVKTAAKLGLDYVELYLGLLADARTVNERADQLLNVGSVATAASRMGLGVSVGYGVDFDNISELSQIEFIEDINVGQALVSRALWVGMENAARDMIALLA